MTIRLVVRWPNESHALLQYPVIDVTADEAPLSPVSQAPGRWEFDIPDGSSSAELKVKFANKVGAKTCLLADHAYRIDGTTLQPDTTPFRIANGEVIAQNVHPLIDLVSAGSAPAGVTIAEVRTEFVDATAIWRSYELAGTELYDIDHENGAELVVLGYTGGSPALWFATFPTMLQPPSPEVSTFVFFRPAMAVRTDEFWRQGTNDYDFVQNGVNRYLLRPRNEDEDYVLPSVPEVPFWTRGSDQIFYVKNEMYLRASFQRAMMQSGRPMVMLLPMPHGTTFADAETGKLPALVRGALRLLRGMGWLGTNHPSITLGRLGIGGYSAGGPATCRALRANRHAVKELFIFDPMFFPPDAPSVIQWARNTPDMRLRMVGANFWASLKGVHEALLGTMSGEAGDAFMTMEPVSPAAWRPGGLKWWDYAVKHIPSLRGDPAAQHQFAQYGGNAIDFDDEGRVSDFRTYIEDFFVGSAF